MIGDRYLGTLGKNMPHGRVRSISLTALINRGQWVDGLRTGEGVLTYGESHAVNVGDSYDGAFLNDLRHGKGRYIWADCKLDKVSCDYDTCDVASWTGRFP